MATRFRDLLKEAATAYERDRARYLAIAMIYYAIVSMVPLLLLLLWALGQLLRVSVVAASAERKVLAAIEETVGLEFRGTLDQLLEGLHQGSTVTLVVGLVGIAFTASVLFGHLRLAFRAIWKYDPPFVSGSMRTVVRTTVLERLKAFAMVLGGGGLLLAALILIASTRWLNRWLGGLPVVGDTAGSVATALGGLMLALLTFASLLKFLPPVPLAWRDVLPSALLCALVWVAAGEFMTLYGAFLGSRPSASGAIGGMLATLLWMNIVAQTLFFGAELSRVTAQRHAGGRPPQAS